MAARERGTPRHTPQRFPIDSEPKRFAASRFWWLRFGVDTSDHLWRAAWPAKGLPVAQIACGEQHRGQLHVDRLSDSVTGLRCTACAAAIGTRRTFA